MPTETRERLLSWLETSSDERLARRTREGADTIDTAMVPSGETLLVLPDKQLLLRPTGLGGSFGGLAVEFEPSSNCIVRLYSCMGVFPRSCLFVGDSILAVDEEEVHSAQDLLEVLEGES